MTKILLIRFSSIGDIVLTTPLLRAIKETHPDMVVHFVTKKAYSSVLENHIYIDKLILLDESLMELAQKLRSENYDLIIDLHQNLRTFLLKTILLKPFKSFKKLNIQKFLLVNFKINRLPQGHIVDRYFKTIETLRVFDDRKGLEYFNGFNDIVASDNLLKRQNIAEPYVALVVGGTWETKQIPINKIAEIIENVMFPVVLLGGPGDLDVAEKIINQFPQKVISAVGKAKLNESAELIRRSLYVITGDTGLMHIAAAYQKKVFSVWGNTVPEFGMYPYIPQNESLSELLEVKDLKCRPCSKLGYRSCPEKHFDCMQKQNFTAIFSYDKSLKENKTQ